MRVQEAGLHDEIFLTFLFYFVLFPRARVFRVPTKKDFPYAISL
jgi:hypothetical protein